MKDKMMICPKAKECDRECTDKKSHLRSKGCRDKRLYPTFSDGSVCPACIPVEPKQQCTDSRSLEDIEQCCGEQVKPFERYAKYEVMKLSDIEKYLTQKQKDELGDIIHTIQTGRGNDGKIPCNSYVVVKEGLPYTEQVWQLIEDYETNATRKLEQPTPTMPLREQEQLYGWDLDKRLDDFKTIAERLEDENYHSRAKAVLYLIERCKRAEAHDSAIASKAVKEFADRVCEDMPLAPFIGGLNPDNPEAFDLLKKGIALRQNICNWIYRAMAEGKE